MSYEGYERILCANGHLEIGGCYNCLHLNEKYADVAEVWHCEDCGALAVWCESVDETNGKGVKTILSEYVAAEFSTCDCCGAIREIKAERYFIPSNHGHRVNCHVEPTVPFVECDVDSE